MLIVPHKVIEGKQRCDFCEEKAPPIRECQCPDSKRRKRGYKSAQWIDLCEACIGRLGALARPYADVNTFCAVVPREPRQTRRRRDNSTKTGVLGPSSGEAG